MNKIVKITGTLMSHVEKSMKFLEEKGLNEGRDYTLSYIALQGSQNYGTDHEGSDIDTRLMINPSHTSLLLKKNFTHDMKMENGEICVIRSTMDALEPLFKGNVNGLEVLYTDFFHSFDSVWTRLRENRDIFEQHFRDNMVKASLGMMKQKQASLLKSTGGNQAEFFEKHGYNGKDYIHIVRLYDTLHKIIRHEKFKVAMNWNQPLFAEFVRAGDYPKDSVIKHVDDMIFIANSSVDKFLEKETFSEFIQECEKCGIREMVAEMVAVYGQS